MSPVPHARILPPVRAAALAAAAFCALIAAGPARVAASSAAPAAGPYGDAAAKMALAADAVRHRLAPGRSGSAAQAGASTSPAGRAAARIREDFLSAGFLPEQVEDFFSAATVLPGPCDGTGAVFAWWNPHWDALFFVRVAGGADAPAGAFRIAATKLVSGETFRGEPVSDGPDRVRTVLPGAAEPLAVRLWRVHAATVAAMRERYPEGGAGAVEFDPALEIALAVEEAPAIQARAGLRVKLAAMLAGDPTNAVAAAKCEALLRGAPVGELTRFFDDRALRGFCRSLAKLPPPVRDGFALSGFVPTPEGALFVFSNETAPGIFATVTFPAGRLGGPFAGAVRMEWYDLAASAALLEAYDSAKAGKEAAR